MGNFDGDTDAVTRRPNTASDNKQSPLPKGDARDKPTIEPRGSTPRPKQLISIAPTSVERSATEQILDPQKTDLQDADVEVLATAMKEYVDNIYKTLETAQTKTLASLREPRAPDRSRALELLGSVVETMAELVADYLTDGMFEIAKGVFGAALGAKKISHGLNEAIHNAGEGIKQKVGGAVGKGVESLGDARERPDEQGLGRNANHNVGNWTELTAKNLIDEYGTRQTLALNQRKADSGIVGASVVAAGRHDRSKLLAFVEELQTQSTSKIYPWYEQQITLQWLNFSAEVSADGNIDEVSPVTLGPIKSASDPRAVTDGVIDIDIAVPDRIWGTQGLALKSMKLTTTSPGAIPILQRSAIPLLDVPLLRRVRFVGNDGKLSDTLPMILYPDGAALPATSDFHLKAIGRLAPVDFSERGQYTNGSPQVERQDAVHAPPDRVHSPLAQELALPGDTGNDTAALRGAELLKSWLAALDTGLLK
jgi:hypothetical protein